MGRRRRAGFTLAELVVAATLTVLVTGATVAMLRSTAAARSRADTQATVQQEARAAIGALATALRNVYRFEGDEAVLEGIDNEVDGMPADRIRFFTLSRRAVRLGQPESDVRECAFFLAPADEGPLATLLRRTDPTRNPPPDGGGVVEVLARGLAGLDFQYHDGVRWRADWPADRDGLPWRCASGCAWRRPMRPRATASRAPARSGRSAGS